MQPGATFLSYTRVFLNFKTGNQSKVPMNDQPTLNMTTLDALRSFQEEGEPDFLTELINDYLLDAPLRLTALSEAITLNAIDLIARAAHGLKGSSANMGAVRLAQLLFELELVVKSSDLSILRGRCHEIENEFQAVKKGLEALRKN
jgi:two-component system, sensor histidine kinase and response regulator